jgi:hypothetical protein
LLLEVQERLKEYFSVNGEHGAREMKVRTESLILLLFLTAVVVAYNYECFNVPHSTYLNAYKTSYSPGEHWQSFQMTLSSAGFPLLNRNVTDDTDFRALTLDYVKASDDIRDIIRIPAQSSAEWWLKKASNSSQGYDMNVQFFNDSYFLQVRSLPDVQRTAAEYEVLLFIDITTAIAWALAVTRVIRAR